LTYASNVADVVRHKDIATALDGELGAKLTSSERKLKRDAGELHLGLAGPPCQGHSDLNNHTRRDDKRNALYARVARAAAVLEPKFLCVENVPAILNDRAAVLETTRTELERLGYVIADEVVDMSLAGIPQRRRRHILLACEAGYGNPADLVEQLVEHPCRDHLPRDVHWAIDDLKGSRSEETYDTASVPSDENRRRIAYLFDHRRYDLPNSERPECHRDFEHTYDSMYGRLRWDAPAQTITSGYGSMGQGRYVHPGRRRTLTPHEAARLQTIPDWFTFAPACSRTALARMIGNAVPPFLAMEVGRRLLPLLVSNRAVEAVPVTEARDEVRSAA
jgi:DNA (cytosine-5)-methyltransferase 1